MNSQYSAAGVDYDTLDAAKRSAIEAAASVDSVLATRNAVSFDASRGEPAFVFSVGDQILATVLECLGTKSSVARICQESLGVNRFDAIGYDTVAAVANDIVCVGALPVTVNAYFATGSPQWYHQHGRFDALVRGWAQACRDSGATWGGGESPGLSGIVDDAEIDLAGSAVGAVPSGVVPILGDDIAPGDEIVLVSSSGVHANGLSLIRKLANELPDGYATKLPSGRSFGVATLDASEIYVCLVESLLRQHIPVSYLSHITGHGFRKIMRASAEVTYRITQVPPVPEVLQFVVERLGMDANDAYGTFNMGAGFAVYCRAGYGAGVARTAETLGFGAWVAGVVEAGPRGVVIDDPKAHLQVTFSEADLQLR